MISARRLETESKSGLARSYFGFGFSVADPFCSMSVPGVSGIALVVSVPDVLEDPDILPDGAVPADPAVDDEDVDPGTGAGGDDWPSGGWEDVLAHPINNSAAVAVAVTNLNIHPPAWFVFLKFP
jgi:hypothetical protein